MSSTGVPVSAPDIEGLVPLQGQRIVFSIFWVATTEFGKVALIRWRAGCEGQISAVAPVDDLVEASP